MTDDAAPTDPYSPPQQPAGPKTSQAASGLTSGLLAAATPLVWVPMLVLSYLEAAERTQGPVLGGSWLVERIFFASTCSALLALVRALLLLLVSRARAASLLIVLGAQTVYSVPVTVVAVWTGFDFPFLSPWVIGCAAANGLGAFVVARVWYLDRRRRRRTGQ